MSDQWVRVTDDVTPRREYSIRESQVTEDHAVLPDKDAAFPDGTPRPPKHLPAQMSPKIPAPIVAVKQVGGQTSPKEKE